MNVGQMNEMGSSLGDKHVFEKTIFCFKLEGATWNVPSAEEFTILTGMLGCHAAVKAHRRKI